MAQNSRLTGSDLAAAPWLQRQRCSPRGDSFLSFSSLIPFVFYISEELWKTGKGASFEDGL